GTPAQNQDRSLKATPSTEKAISRVPTPLVEKEWTSCHSSNKPLPRDPFDTPNNLFRINYAVVEDPIIPCPPN
ncbi:hypothetical protein A2U01_0075909, partial [Trifolium medium]|nr:hypothetical protein [Trifolium medium]